MTHTHKYGILFIVGKQKGGEISGVGGKNMGDGRRIRKKVGQPDGRLQKAKETGMKEIEVTWEYDEEGRKDAWEKGLNADEYQRKTMQFSEEEYMNVKEKVHVNTNGKAMYCCRAWGIWRDEISEKNVKEYSILLPTAGWRGVDRAIKSAADVLNWEKYFSENTLSEEQYASELEEKLAKAKEEKAIADAEKTKKRETELLQLYHTGKIFFRNEKGQFEKLEK